MGEDNKEGSETHIAIFKGKAIRRKFVENKWFFFLLLILFKR